MDEQSEAEEISGRNPQIPGKVTPVPKTSVDSVDNETLMQYFEWYLPDDGLLWREVRAKAKKLKNLGVTAVWLPPAYKGTSSADVGYGAYDLYDLGEFNQKGTVRTKYGTKKEYLNAVKALHGQGIKVIADIVLNQKMAADETEEVEAVEVDPNDRRRDVSGPEDIKAWTKFTFPGRHGKYSKFIWTKDCFSGVDSDAATGRHAIFRLNGRPWNPEVDDENGNFDYLMGADLDFRNPRVAEETKRWGKWYYDTVKMDGFRLDALKHISWSFMADWLTSMRQYAGRDLPAVGEMWSPDLQKLIRYSDHTGHIMKLFDAPLHYKFMSAGQMWDRFPMRYLFNDTFVQTNPDEAVTCVDNHDTEPDQPLESYVEAWFKPLAYALILLRKDGIPCVFYGDFYGVPDHKIAPVSELPVLMKIRKLYAYGGQNDYFDDDHMIGWTREGDARHPDSGLACVMTNGNGGTKRMKVGEAFAGATFLDALGKCHERVTIDGDGWGNFAVSSGSVSVWLTQKAYARIRIHR